MKNGNRIVYALTPIYTRAACHAYLSRAQTRALCQRCECTWTAFPAAIVLLENHRPSLKQLLKNDLKQRNGTHLKQQIQQALKWRRGN